MKRIKQENGITLIALVITIIVLLILAGIAINLTLGENGLLKQAGWAKEEHTNSSIKEELEMDISSVVIDKSKKNEPVTKPDIADYIKDKVTIFDVTEDKITGEYEDREIIIDENNNVIIGPILSGAKPTAEFIKNPETPGADKVTIQVIGSTVEGEIVSIESLNSLTPILETSNFDKTYEVNKNGEYRFKVTGSNGRKTVVSVKINNIIEESESLLEGISKITQSGETKIRVKGSIDGTTETTEDYNLNVIYHKGNLTLGDTLKSGENDIELENLVLSNTTWVCGNSSDVGKNTVVLKVDGDITIEEGKTLTSVVTSNNGPKGMVIYCTGNMKNNGVISMSSRGCITARQNIYLYKTKENTYITVPKDGGSGGAPTTGLEAGTPGTGGRSSHLLGCGGGGGATNYSGVYGATRGETGGSYGGGRRRKRWCKIWLL